MTDEIVVEQKTVTSYSIEKSEIPDYVENPEEWAKDVLPMDQQYEEHKSILNTEVVEE